MRRPLVATRTPQHLRCGRNSDLFTLQAGANTAEAHWMVFETWDIACYKTDSGVTVLEFEIKLVQASIDCNCSCLTQDKDLVLCALQKWCEQGLQTLLERLCQESLEEQVKREAGWADAKNRKWLVGLCYTIVPAVNWKIETEEWTK